MIDAIRGGRARERELAKKELIKRLERYGEKENGGGKIDLGKDHQGKK